MSLANPDDEYDELLPSGRNPLKRILGGSKKIGVVLLIGVILGLIITIFFLNPIFNQTQISGCRDCYYTKELLNKENECLYSVVPDPKKVAQACGTINAINSGEKNQQKTQSPIKDYNEEPGN